MDLREVRLRAVEHAVAGLGVGGNRRERLVQFVGNAGGHLAHRGEAGDLRQTGLGAAALLLHLPVLGQVVDEAHEAWRCGARDLAHRQARREQAPVLALALHLPAAADHVGDAGDQVAADVRVMRRGDIRRHQHADVVAEAVGGAMAEKALNRAVDGLDEAAVVDDDDCIDCGVQQGLQVAVGL